MNQLPRSCWCKLAFSYAVAPFVHLSHDRIPFFQQTATQGCLRVCIGAHDNVDSASSTRAHAGLQNIARPLVVEAAAVSMPCGSHCGLHTCNYRFNHSRPGLRRCGPGDPHPHFLQFPETGLTTASAFPLHLPQRAYQLCNPRVCGPRRCARRLAGRPTDGGNASSHRPDFSLRISHEGA